MCLISDRKSSSDISPQAEPLAAIKAKLRSFIKTRWPQPVKGDLSPRLVPLVPYYGRSEAEGV